MISYWKGRFPSNAKLTLQEDVTYFWNVVRASVLTVNVPNTMEQEKRLLKLSESRIDNFFNSLYPLAPDCFIPNSVIRKRMFPVSEELKTLEKTEEMEISKLLAQLKSVCFSDFKSEGNFSDETLYLDFMSSEHMRHKSTNFIKSESSNQIYKATDSEASVSTETLLQGLSNANVSHDHLRKELINKLAAKRLLVSRKQVGLKKRFDPPIGDDEEKENELARGNNEDTCEENLNQDEESISIILQVSTHFVAF